jgi:hypothetical protein
MRPFAPIAYVDGSNAFKSHSNEPLATSPVFADGPEYPPGLFEKLVGRAFGTAPRNDSVGTARRPQASKLAARMRPTVIS